MNVFVEQPEVIGDRVQFRWTQSEENPFQIVNEFFFRYEDLDLGQFSTALFYEIFIALQLRVFAAFGGPVEIVFSEPVSDWTFSYWQAYHEAGNVIATPLEGGAYSPWRQGDGPAVRPGTAAVFFGGGKDSLATACILSEIYGREHVRLVQYVVPIRPKKELLNRLELRQEGLMLAPARELLGVGTQRAWTDYQSNFLRSADAQRPDIELFAAGALPILLDAAVPLATFSYEWPDYPVERLADGSLYFHRPLSRPEYLSTLQAHYRQTLGRDLTVTNLNSLLSPWTGHRLLAERYPGAIPGMASCTLGQIEERWCYDCRKCLMYGLFTIFSGPIDDRFDYERLFDRARYLMRIVEHSTTGVELAADGNAPFALHIGVEQLYQTFCHVVWGANPDLIKERLSINAYSNLLILKAMYGNRPYSHIEQMPSCVVPRLGFSDADRVAAIISQHLEPVEFITEPLSVGNQPAEFGLHHIMPTKTGGLPHIRGVNSSY